MFELTGTTTIPTGRRRKASLAWHDDGTITGDLRLMSEAERLIARRERVKATPTGPSAVAGLQPRRVAVSLLASLFDSFDWTGDFPGEILDIEEGAIS